MGKKKKFSKDRDDKPREERAPRKERPAREERAAKKEERPKRERKAPTPKIAKYFEITSSSLDDAKSQAMENFKITDSELLQWEVIKAGKKWIRHQYRSGHML